MNEMSKQMEMFDDGGLMDEGGTVDPVSGNDVPPGSNQEEVRDDIPAQLSEGEFVFPADVVRFIGLEKLMMIRQRAKAGLQRMEDMGQMGNSEEAVMPDDLPFSIEDLDMEDDGLEMAQGGVVHMANGGTYNVPDPSAGVYYNPAGSSTTGVATAPVQAASSAPSIGQAATPVTPGSAIPMNAGYQLPQAPVPVMDAPKDLPPFLGGVVPGVGGVDYTEEVYVNDAGQTITFRRYTDGSLKDAQGNEAVIPEGYKLKSEADKKVTTDPTTVKPATVQDDGGGDGGAGDESTQSSASVTLGGQSGTGRQKGLRVGDYKTFGVSYDVPGGLPGVAGALSTVGGLALGKGLPAGATANIFDRDFPNASVTVSAADFNAMKAAGYKGELADMYKGALSTTADILNNKAVNIAAPDIMGTKTGRMLDANGNPIGDKAQGIVEKAVVGSVLSNVKTSVPGFLGQINNLGKVSFEEAVANANDAQKAVLDNMGVDYDTSLDVTAAEKADMARQEKEALEMITFLANERKAEKARAEAEQRQRDEAQDRAADEAAAAAQAAQSRRELGGYERGDGGSGGNDDRDTGQNEASAGGAGGGYGLSHAKGGLVSQMKRSGLASKK